MKTYSFKQNWKLFVFGLAIIGAPGITLASHASSDQGLQITDTYVKTPTDKIPRFCNPPNVASVILPTQSGNWSNTSIWPGNQVPGAGARIQIPAGISVVYDVNNSTALECLEISGSLTFATNLDTSLHFNDLLVMPTGSLTIGTPSQPIQADKKAELVFNGYQLKTGTVENPGIDPQQFGNGLIVLGHITINGEKKDQTFIRISQDPKAGDTTLKLLNAPVGWNVGDHVIVTDSRQERYMERNPQFENVVIAGISGNTITLTAPLKFDHLGAYLPNGTGVMSFNGEPLKAHAVNITRNIVLRSQDTAWHSAFHLPPDDGNQLADPMDMRGHVLITNRAVADIRYAQFDHMGRTDGGNLDSSTFDKNAKLTHVGINQIGRYALHFHRLFGPVNPGNTGYQFRAEGNAITNFKKWGMAIHASHYGSITNNVMVGNTDPANIGLQGAGFALEDGTESYNDITNNFAGIVRGTVDPQYEDWPQKLGGVASSGFWFHGPNDGGTFKNNVAADAIYSESAAGLTMIFTNPDNKRPLFRGAYPTSQGEYETLAVRSLPVNVENFETYAVGQGVHIWDLWPPQPQTTGFGRSIFLTDNVVRKFEKLDIWHSNAHGIHVAFAANLLIDRLKVIGNGNHIPNVNGGVTLYVGRALNTTIRNATIVAQRLGITLPSDTSGPTDSSAPGITRIENSYLENETNVSETTLFSFHINNILSSRIPPADAFIVDTILKPYKFSIKAKQPYFPVIDMNYRPMTTNVQCLPDGSANLIQSQRVFVKNYNREPNRNFQVFFKEQAPDFVVPQSAICRAGFPDLGRIGSPEAGLTNAQNWEKYKVAIAGTVAPCNATLPEIKGFVCPWDGTVPENPNIPNIPTPSFTPTPSATPTPSFSPTPSSTPTTSATPTPTIEPPVIILDPNLTSFEVRIGEPITFTVTASSKSANSMTLEAVNLPTSATFQ